MLSALSFAAVRFRRHSPGLATGSVDVYNSWPNEGTARVTERTSAQNQQRFQVRSFRNPTLKGLGSASHRTNRWARPPLCDLGFEGLNHQALTGMPQASVSKQTILIPRGPGRRRSGVHWFIEENLATKRDIADVEQDIADVKRDIKELDLKIEQVQTELKRDVKELEVALKQDIKELETKLTHDVKNLGYRMTIKLGALLVVAVGAMGALVKLFHARVARISNAQCGKLTGQWICRNTLRYVQLRSLATEPQQMLAPIGIGAGPGYPDLVIALWHRRL